MTDLETVEAMLKRADIEYEKEEHKHIESNVDSVTAIEGFEHRSVSRNTAVVVAYL